MASLPSILLRLGRPLMQYEQDPLRTLPDPRAESGQASQGGGKSSCVFLNNGFSIPQQRCWLSRQRFHGCHHVYILGSKGDQHFLTTGQAHHRIFHSRRQLALTPLVIFRVIFIYNAGSLMPNLLSLELQHFGSAYKYCYSI
jgi:hypothetical protein